MSAASRNAGVATRRAINTGAATVAGAALTGLGAVASFFAGLATGQAAAAPKRVRKPAAKKPAAKAPAKAPAKKIAKAAA